MFMIKQVITLKSLEQQVQLCTRLMLTATSLSIQQQMNLRYAASYMTSHY